ncbi:hypothetical protein [Streptomyces sp. NPDC004726]
MRTTARLTTSAALAAATLGLGLGASAAHAADLNSLDAFPTTAGPGSTMTMNTAVCDGEGQAIGDARPLSGGGLRLSSVTYEEAAVGKFRIPRGTESGSYPLVVRCKTGGQSASANVIALGNQSTEDRSRDDEGRDRGGYGGDERDKGGHDEGRDKGGREDERDKGGNRDEGRDKGGYGGDERDKGGHDEGRDKGGREDEGRREPRGHVRTGLGGSVGPDTTQITAGAAVLAATAVGGALLLRRRARDAQGG